MLPEYQATWNTFKATLEASSNIAIIVEDKVGDDNERITIFKRSIAGTHHALIIFEDGTSKSGLLS